MEHLKKLKELVLQHSKLVMVLLVGTALMLLAISRSTNTVSKFNSEPTTSSYGLIGGYKNVSLELIRGSTDEYGIIKSEFQEIYSTNFISVNNIVDRKVEFDFSYYWTETYISDVEIDILILDGQTIMGEHSQIINIYK